MGKPNHSIGKKVFFITKENLSGGRGRKGTIVSMGFIYRIYFEGSSRRVSYQVVHAGTDKYIIPQKKIFLTEEDALDFLRGR